MHNVYNYRYNIKKKTKYFANLYLHKYRYENQNWNNKRHYTIVIDSYTIVNIVILTIFNL